MVSSGSLPTSEMKFLSEQLTVLQIDLHLTCARTHCLCNSYHLFLVTLSPDDTKSLTLELFLYFIYKTKHMALVRSMKSKHILTQALAKRICTSCSYIHTKNLWTLFYYWFTTHQDIITQPQPLSCHIINFIDHISS